MADTVQVDAFGVIAQHIAGLERVVMALLLHAGEWPARNEFCALCLAVAEVELAYAEYMSADARLAEQAVVAEQAEQAVVAELNGRTAGGLRDEPVTSH